MRPEGDYWWPDPKDPGGPYVQRDGMTNHGEWPMRQSSLLFGGRDGSVPEYVELWKSLPADSNVEEVIRNFFIRQPVVWLK